MLLSGTNIRLAGEKMQPISIKEMYEKISNPDMKTASLIRELRCVKLIDPKRYHEVKRNLPYVVCGHFTPEYRKLENFAYTECFIIDIDNLVTNGYDPDSIKAKIAADERVVLCFLSPGGDGVKALFVLKERCYDSGTFKLFYKEFASRLAAEMHLENVIDTCTCDVSRACFLSHDSNAYINLDAVKVDLSAYINTESALQLFDLKHKHKQKEKEEAAMAASNTETEHATKEPEPDIMQRIHAQLKKSGVPIHKKPEVYVPKEITNIMDGLKQNIENLGVSIDEMIDIHYGKKLRMSGGGQMAEVNIFYGKRGFSVVESPRKGTSGKFNEAIGNIIRQHLNSPIYDTANSNDLPY